MKCLYTELECPNDCEKFCQQQREDHNRFVDRMDEVLAPFIELKADIEKRLARRKEQK